MTMNAETPTRNLPLAAVAMLLVLATSIAGSYATVPHLGWYAGLTKPPFNPPNWIFAPVWTTLYVLMAFAAWRIIRQPASPTRSLALAAFFTQLALNAAWSWMFFAAENTLLGLINIVPQLLTVIATFVLSYRVDRYAGYVLAPLVGWVAFASILNASVWWLN